MDIRELAKRTGYVPSIKSKPVVRAHDLIDKRSPVRDRPPVRDLGAVDPTEAQLKREQAAREVQARLERARLIKEQKEKRRRWGGYYRRMDTIDVRVNRIHLRRAKLKKLVDALDAEVKSLLEERKGLVAVVGELPAQEPPPEATEPEATAEPTMTQGTNPYQNTPENEQKCPSCAKIVGTCECARPDHRVPDGVQGMPTHKPTMPEPAPEPAPEVRPQYRYCVNCLHLKSICTCGAS